MNDLSGFRIEVSSRSKLGRKLATLSNWLCNRSDAKGVVRKKVMSFHQKFGWVEGVWTVRPSGAISFKGRGKLDWEIEYVYGKLTIGKKLFHSNPTKVSCVPKEEALKTMLKLIDQWFPFMPSRVELDLVLHTEV